ncbi:MAG: hypothetical protein M3126_09510, partial [Candidatus Eremiobacteraeota bacterium]|nr:hypothetical protein [Candidatus Eremiobacteraeota bacterium]
MSVPLLVRAKTIVTCATGAPQSGVTFERLGMHSPGSLLCVDGRVEKIGTPREVEADLAGDVDVLDLPDCIVVPGFMDAHTHPLFAGDREPDFAARQRGDAAPLGMLYTVEQTRKALEDHHTQPAFWKLVRQRLHLMALHGTTTAEVKTGYALHKEGETQLLDLIDAHKDQPDLPRLIST